MWQSHLWHDISCCWLGAASLSKLRMSKLPPIASVTLMRLNHLTISQIGGGKNWIRGDGQEAFSVRRRRVSPEFALQSSILALTSAATSNLAIVTKWVLIGWNFSYWKSKSVTVQRDPVCAQNVVRSLVKKAAADKDWVAGWQSRVLVVKNTNVWTRKRGAVIRLGD